MLLEHRSFLVKERVAFLKVTDRYDIFDPETGEQIGFAKEKINSLVSMLRVIGISKQMLATTIVIKEDDDSEPVVTLKRPPSFFRSKVSVIDRNQTPVGFFRSKIFSLGGGFTVHKPTGEQIADVKGNWKGWDFKLTDMEGRELGNVNKKWAGTMKELFTSADTYVITLSESIGTNPGLAALLLAAGLAIDIVFKEAE